MPNVSNLLKATKTLNTLLWPVVALSFLESTNLLLAFRLPASTVASLAWMEFIVNNALKLFITAFAYGFLADIALKNELFQTKAALFNNIRSFLILTFVLSGLPYLAHFIVFISSSNPMQINIPFHTIQMVCQPVIAILLLRVVLAKKAPDLLAKDLSLSALLTIIAAIIVFYLAYGLYFCIPDELNAVKSLTIFTLKYAGFWMFLAFLHTMINESPSRNNPDQTENEIILISPPLGGIVQGIVSIATHSTPFVFTIIKALTPVQYSFREYTRIAWRKDFFRSGRLVAITSMSTNIILAYKVAKEFRKQGSKVVMGGPHVTAFPDEALEFCDAVVIGPVESIWKDIIRDYEQGTLHGKYAAPPLEKDFATTNEFLLKKASPYLAHRCLETTRGCKFNCYFCGGGHLKIGYHQHPIETTIALARKAAQHARTVVFIDDNIYSNPAYTKELFERLRPLNIRWRSSASLDIAKDPELIKLCKASGCVGLTIGYETFPGSKESGKGKFAMAEDYIKLTNVLKKAGIPVIGNFIYGFESDDFFSFWKLWAFMIRLSLNSTRISLFTPIPNSRFYQDIENSDRFINLNWNRLDGMSLMFKHPKLNNPLFRDGFMLITVFSVATTSWFGRILLVFTIFYITMGWA